MIKKCRCGCRNKTKHFFYPGHQNIGKRHSHEHMQKTRRPMELNGRWKGGRIIDKSGYVLIKKPDHPNANNSGYVREHRLVMENYVGRTLSKHEVVHHKNGKKNDNRIENLELMTQSEHQRFEQTGRIHKKYGRFYKCRKCKKKFYRSPYFSKKKTWQKWCSWLCRYPKSNHFS